jgi:hypothetical protein
MTTRDDLLVLLLGAPERGCQLENVPISKVSVLKTASRDRIC